MVLRMIHIKDSRSPPNGQNLGSLDFQGCPPKMRFVTKTFFPCNTFQHQAVGAVQKQGNTPQDSVKSDIGVFQNRIIYNEFFSFLYNVVIWFQKMQNVVFILRDVARRPLFVIIHKLIDIVPDSWVEPGT